MFALEGFINLFLFVFVMLFQAAMQNSGAIYALLIIFLMLLLFASIIFSFIFWIWMIVDCAKRKNIYDGERVAWIIVLVFLQVIGAVIYYFAVKRK